VFVGVHLFALWADNFVYFGGREMFIPFASQWRPGAVAWGIAATYLLVAIQVTSWMMKRLPRKLWHSVHLLSIPMFVFSTIHGFTSGADNKNLAVQWVALTGGLAVFLLISFRVLAPRRSRGGAARSERAARAPQLPERALRGRSAEPVAAVETEDAAVAH
jgi:DMSO/TMAO reductase YedYZ heme-binding membrane subunit